MDGCFFGIACAGAVVVPINKDLSVDDIEILLKRTDITNIFDNSLIDTINKIKVDMPEIENMVSLQQDSYYPSICSRLGESEVIFTSTVTPNTTAVIVFTSGTTGYNKGVQLSHKNLCSSVQHSAFLLNNDIKPGYNIFSILPTHHMFLITTGVLSAFEFGVCICIGEGIKYISKSIKFFKPQVILTVPMVIENLYNRIIIKIENKGMHAQVKKSIENNVALDVSGIDIRNNILNDISDVFGGKLEIVICGGASLTDDMVDNFNTLGIHLLNGYGITECSSVVSCNVPKLTRRGSVGCVNLSPYCKVKVKDGEIMVSGDIIMQGYYKAAYDTAESFDGKWFNTGDLGRIDEDGFLYITGRKKDVIILADGNNICPYELEEQLKKISLIKDVVVYAKSIGKNSVIAASIYPNFKAVEGLADYDLKEKIKTEVYKISSRWPRYKQIQLIEFVSDEFDKTSLGKIKRYKLIQ